MLTHFKSFVESGEDNKKNNDQATSLQLAANQTNRIIKTSSVIERGEGDTTNQVETSNSKYTYILL